MKRFNQHGFSFVEVILIVVIIAILAFIGWRIYDAQSGQPSSNEQSTSQSSKEAPKVENADDLEKAAQYLNDTKVDEQLSTKEIDGALTE